MVIFNFSAGGSSSMVDGKKRDGNFRWEKKEEKK